MKNVMVLFVSAVVYIGSVSAVALSDYAKGVVDQDGDNLWHILAQGCHKECFDDYRKLLADIEVDPEEEKLLFLLATEKNNKNQSPLDIAAENWVQYENDNCVDVMHMICAWKAMELQGHRSKNINPFRTFLKVNKEDQSNSGD